MIHNGDNWLVRKMIADHFEEVVRYPYDIGNNISNMTIWIVFLFLIRKQRQLQGLRVQIKKNQTGFWENEYSSANSIL